MTEPTPTPSQAKRAQRKRQRDRLKRQLAEHTGQRNRARRDRERLAEWIEQNVEGAEVWRAKSGGWSVVT